jgi:hypothetical protein
MCDLMQYEPMKPGATQRLQGSGVAKLRGLQVCLAHVGVACFFVVLVLVLVAFPCSSLPCLLRLLTDDPLG